MLDAARCVAVSPQRHQPLQARLADLQGAEAAVEGALEPGFNNHGEALGPTAAEQRQAGEVLWERVQVIGVAIDAGQPAAPHWPLRLVGTGEGSLGVDLWRERTQAYVTGT